MQYCGPRGIPHSQFLDWSDEDQDKALAWVLGEAEKCPRCGSIPSDWLDEEGVAVEPPPWVATSNLCVGCEAIGDKLSEIPEDRRHMYHVYLRRPRPEDFELS